MVDGFLGIPAGLVLALMLAAVARLLVRRHQRHAEIEAMPDEDDVPEPPAGDENEPVEVRRPGPEGRMVPVFKSDGGGFEADLLAGALKSRGIWAHVDGGHTSQALSGTGLARMTLRVPERDLGRARRIVAELREQAHGEDSTLARCPACGYDLRATPDRCPECGLALQ